MKVSIFWCVLLGFLIAVPLSHRSTLRVLSADESADVCGAQIGGLYPWTKCGTTDECAANSCSVDACYGWYTTPIDDAPNQGCADIDWLSLCIDHYGFNILEQRPPCATKRGTCWPTTEEQNGILVVTECREVVGQGFVFTPTAPNSCRSVSLVDFLFPL